MDTPLRIVAVLFGFFGLAGLVLTVFLWRRHKRIASVITGLIGIVGILLAALTATISVATLGYKAFTKEEVAAVVEVVPLALQEFEARFEFQDGRRESYRIRGDELYVDAHVLKWKPLGNLLGLHTSYELSRVAGRYITLDDELNKERTLYALSEKRSLDMFELRMRHWIFRPFLDAEYGSGTFLHVTRHTRIEVRVTTSGLILREMEAADVE